MLVIKRMDADVVFDEILSGAWDNPEGRDVCLVGICLVVNYNEDGFINPQQPVCNFRF